jgi:hypothetical protein
MKTLLRASALAAALALILLATGHATPVPTGTCEIFCSNLDTGSYSTQYWGSTEGECCSQTLNPCPAGATPTVYAFQPYYGFAELCQPE